MRDAMKRLHLSVESQAGAAPVTVDIDQLVICGWAGRDKVAMAHHMAELEAIGVKPPASTPVYYNVAAARLMTGAAVEDLGANASGEVEAVLFSSQGRLYVGVGSDHTDRHVETYGISLSKQICDKPVAAQVWAFDEVADHWDDLILRSFAVFDGERRLYQEGAVSGLQAPLDLVSGLWGEAGMPEGTALFCGTLSAIGGIKPSCRFEGELEDPVLGRVIRFAYDVKTLPIMG